MTDSQNSPDTEPEEGAAPETAEAKKGTSGRRSFQNLRRELTDEELSSPAVQRMLLDEIERLDSECGDVRTLREKFHISDKKVGILEERFKTKVAIEIIHVACISLAGAALGYAASNWATQHTVSIIALVFGGVLLVAGLAAKVIKP